MSQENAVYRNTEIGVIGPNKDRKKAAEIRAKIERYWGEEPDKPEPIPEHTKRDAVQKELVSYPLIGGKQIQGTCYNKTQLSAKFQIWARRFGVSDRDSLAYLVCDKPSSWPNYFSSEIEMLRNAAECEREIALQDIPADFGTEIPSGQICFAVIEITV